MSKLNLVRLTFLFVAASVNGFAADLATEQLWKDVLSDSRVSIPADPGGKVTWRKDFAAARAEAQQKGMPLLVTWRCLPCEQCAEFDKEILEGSESLDPLLRRFITVRLTNADLLDERYFPYRTHQDLDLSWWAYFMSSDGDYYGVFGGKDHVSENTRISEAAFENSLERVLKHHYAPQRAKWGIDLPVGYASKTKSVPSNSQGYRILAPKQPWLGKPHKEHGSCFHCHQVADMLTAEKLDAGTFKVEDLTQKWPLPENVGILLDRDDGLLVKRVTRGSAADIAGVKVGDRLAMAEGSRLFGQADFRGVLHRAAFGADSIDMAWERNGRIQFGTLEVKNGWREVEHSWRKSVYDGIYGPGLGFFPLKGPKSGKGQGLSIKPWMGPKAKERPVYQSGLRPGMEIVAIDDMTKDMETRDLITWFRLNHKPGDTVTYTVKGGRKFRFVIPQE